MGSGKRAGREVSSKTGAEVVFSFLVKVQRENRISSEPYSTSSCPKSTWAHLVYQHGSVAMPALSCSLPIHIALGCITGEHQQLPWPPRMFFTRCRYSSCHPFSRFLCWLGSAMMKVVQCWWPVGRKEDRSDIHSLGSSVAASITRAKCWAMTERYNSWTIKSHPLPD